MAKNDHIYFTCTYACRELLKQDDEVEYTGKTAELRKKFISNLDKTIIVYSGMINKGTETWYRRTIKAFDAEIAIGSKWIPLLLCNEIMSHFANRPMWKDWSFQDLYDHMDGAPEDTENKMYEKASKIMERIHGHKRNEQKAKRLLKLKHTKIRVKHEAN